MADGWHTGTCIESTMSRENHTARSKGLKAGQTKFGRGIKKDKDLDTYTPFAVRNVTEPVLRYPSIRAHLPIYRSGRPVIKIGPKGALGSHEIRPIHSAPSLGQSIRTYTSVKFYINIQCMKIIEEIIIIRHRRLYFNLGKINANITMHNHVPS